MSMAAATEGGAIAEGVVIVALACSAGGGAVVWPTNRRRGSVRLAVSKVSMAVWASLYFCCLVRPYLGLGPQLSL